MTGMEADATDIGPGRRGPPAAGRWLPAAGAGLGTWGYGGWLRRVGC